MSTEVEQQQPTVAAATTEENGAPAETAPNGEHKTEEKKNGSAKKEPEPPKDLRDDTVGWLGQHHKQFTHLVSFENAGMRPNSECSARRIHRPPPARRDLRRG